MAKATAIAAGNAGTGRIVDTDRPLVDEKLVLCFFIASLSYVLIAMLAGLLFSLQFLQIYPFANSEFFSPGRWRFVHTQGVAYGFIANAFLGALHWAVPRLTGNRVLSDKLSWFILFAWQAIVLATVVGVLSGEAQALEWGETPVWIDPVAQLGLILVAINFLTPILKVKGPMYVTLWYLIAAFIWTPLVYAMGNFLPEYVIGGSAAGAIGGLFIHDLVGLFVTPIGWGLMYYFVPIILKKPIWSHGLSLVGFWGLAFFYPLNGIHHFLYSPIPMFLQYGAVISTIAVELVVTTVIVNFFGTLVGRGDALRTNLSIRWFYIGMVFYFTTCLQCAFQVTLTFQKVIHFTDWVVGHAHLVMFGVFGFWILGMMTHLLPRLMKARDWYCNRWNHWHFWLSGIGLFVMFIDLMIAGLIQGFAWRDLAPWEDSLTFSTPFWKLRTLTGIAIVVGQCFFLMNVYMTWKHMRGAASTTPMPTPTGGGEPAIA
ncbi:MAG: cbb3-type cytochrome c oxidase subunit I [Phycisphaerales bacterium]|nr:cbb3-type cytochrome c oxidase subunit I [Phycisphaerales bacterium]MCB9855710.1 cbb3-type cytochrome c oxidase subunit I [Phycisphaerales bacterium]MCB9862605.1 cbb3-type cytochrome c oxidase subunit I [Phycisphaerales bacterium]